MRTAQYLLGYSGSTVYDTTKLYVEYIIIIIIIIIGMETLGWILLILIALLKDTMLKFIDYCIKNIVSTILIVGICYILGLITDRISDMILEKRKNRMKAKYSMQSKTSILVWENINQNTFATFTLSRIRLLRSTIVNSLFLMITSIWVAIGVYNNGVLAVFFGILFSGVMILANGAHINLLNNYYKKTADLEKSLFDKNNKVK